STQNDVIHGSESEEARKAADELLSFLTPIAKAFLTEVGYESANHGVQVYGGHGFIREWGMEQIVRDTRISMLYEGTTQIQALDLLGRKVLQTQGGLLKNFTKIVHKFCEANKDDAAASQFAAPLAALNKEWGDLTMKIGMKAMQNPNEVGAAAVDYLMYSGYVTLAYLWALMAKTAQDKIAAGEGDKAFYEAKIKTAQFYFKKILPRTKAHVEAIDGGLDVLMQMDVESFAF
ncbi:MAG: acyl-CoA dehydrogenase C-terminal domain-containing protein, partial [Perlucidibaca sp.]